MVHALLLSVVLLVPQARAAAPQVGATGWEDAGRLGAAVAAKAGQLAPRVAARARILSGKTNSADLSILFEMGAKPEPEDLVGWYTGRRFTKTGPAAQLLVGGESYPDPVAGPIAGKAFKLMVFGPKEAGIVPTDLYDEPGTYLVDTVKYLVYENGKDWTPPQYTDTEVMWKKGQDGFQLRKWGRYLICKNPEGDYSYFFKKVSGTSGAKGVPAETRTKQGILPLPGSDELSSKFDTASAPTEAAITGWFAGRRFTTTGPAAALLVGTEVYDDPEAGPINGTSFKIIVFGADKADVVPAELFDIGGQGMINGVAYNLRELAPKWKTTRTASGYVTTDGERSFEVRQSGDYFIIRYPESFGYFFKKIR